MSKIQTEPKRICFFGQVDHGKSTLAGHLLAKVGHFSLHEIEKTTKEAEEFKMSRWKWAYLLDVQDEERTRGKTHEFSILPFQRNNNKYEVIDTPGHSSFVRSTIQGIATYPNVIGVLVLSAIENEFKSGMGKGMTKEQCILARASGVKHLIVAVNKMDAVGWEDKIFTDIKIKMKTFLKALRFESLHFLAVSAYDGTNILSILDTVDKITLTVETQDNEKTPRDKMENISDKIRCKCKILFCETIISPGFECILHFNGEEHDVVIEKMKGKKFARSGDICECLLRFSSPIDVGKIKRVILRKNEYTIGYAVVN